MEQTSTIKHLKDRSAWLLSGLLSPFVLVPLFTALFVGKFYPDTWDFLKLYLLCAACSIGVPALYISLMVYRGNITDIHVKNLEQRRGPFRAGLLGLACQPIALYWLAAPRTLLVYSLALLLSGIAFAWISEYWKISVHTGTLGCLLAGALQILHWNPLWLLLQFPLIWARTHRKRHHPWQGLAGAVLGFFPTWLSLELWAP